MQRGELGERKATVLQRREPFSGRVERQGETAVHQVGARKALLLKVARKKERKSGEKSENTWRRKLFTKVIDRGKGEGFHKQWSSESEVLEVTWWCSS